MIVKQLANIYAGIINQYKFKGQTLFSARFDKQDEDDHVIEKTELYNNLKISPNFTPSGVYSIDVRSQLEQQTQNQESKDSSWDLMKVLK